MNHLNSQKISKTYPLVNTFSNNEFKNNTNQINLVETKEENEEDDEEIDLEEYLKLDSIRSVIIQ